MLILASLFFLFGFVTWLNGALIPYLRIACELGNLQSMLVAFAFYIAYAVMALPSAWLLRRTGLKRGMTIGLWMMAAGTLVFLPAAATRTYGLFLAGLFVIGTGLAVLQTASNPYVTIIGPLESAARRISIMGVCNKVAGMLAPLVLGAMVLSDADALTAELQVLQGTDRVQRLDELAGRAFMPYAMLSAFLVVLGLLLRWSPLPELDAEPGTNDASDAGRSVLGHPHLVLGVVALFLYVGVEVIAGDTIGNYGLEQGLPLSVARHLTSYTLAAMVLGYLLGIATIPRYIRQAHALAVSALAGFFLTLGAWLLDGLASVSCIALLGAANALVWPAIWPLAIAGLGRHTAQGAALLVMAIAGGALLPLLHGALADMPVVGAQRAYLLLLPCYAFILWYALLGHRITAWQRQRHSASMD
jgi:glucose/galactose transporter